MSSDPAPRATQAPEDPGSVEGSSLDPSERGIAGASTKSAGGPVEDDIGRSENCRATCENCGTPLEGRYCHACGQEARSLDVSFRSFAGEWLAAVLGFDGRIWRTLGRLLLSPGGLSIDFLEGRRARYVSPLRLYFFVSVAVFLALAVSDSSVVNFSERDASKGSTLTYSWNSGDRDGPPSTEPTTSQEPPSSGEATPDEDEPPPENPTAAAESNDEGNGSESELENKVGQWVSGSAKRFRSDPQAVNKAFLDRMPHAFFLLVPLYALFLKILFRKRYRSYVQHLVVSLHLHTLGFVLLTLGTIADYLLGFRGDEDGPVSSIAVIVLLVNSFMGFRRIYGDRRRTLVWKYALLSFAHLFSLILLLGIALIVTFALL